MIDTVANIIALRAYTPSGTTSPILNDLVYVKYHTSERDGGGGFFMFIDLETKADNDGTVILSSLTSSGRWVRQFHGYMDARFFGAWGQSQPDDGVKIQKAIDAAALNYTYSAYSKGTTIFFPSGIYVITNTLILKEGVSLKGDGVESTLFVAGYPPLSGATNDGYMMELNPGVVAGCNITDIKFVGGVEPKLSSGWDPTITQTKTKG